MTAAISDNVKALIEEIALENKFKDFSISSESENFTGENYLGVITRVKLTDNHQDDKTLNLFLKEPPAGEAVRKTMPVVDFYQREIFTYTNVLPALENIQNENNISEEERFHYPQYYKGSMEELKEVLVMRDISFDGFRLHNRRTPVKFEQIEAVVRNLARLHAASFALKDKNPEKFAELSKSVATSMNYGESIVNMIKVYSKQFLRHVKSAESSTKFEAVSRDVDAMITKLLDPKETEPYNAICHGDCWINNIMFRFNMEKVSKVMFVDWQIIRLASPITDLTYAIYLITDQPLRDQHFDQILKTYYDTLEHNLTKMGCDIEKLYPRSVFEDHVQRVMPFGLLMAVVALPILLKARGDEQKIEEAAGDVENEEFQIQFLEEVKTRLNDTIDDFVKRKYI